VTKERTRDRAEGGANREGTAPAQRKNGIGTNKEIPEMPTIGRIDKRPDMVRRGGSGRQSKKRSGVYRNMKGNHFQAKKSSRRLEGRTPETYKRL